MFADWMTKQTQLDKDFSQKIIFSEEAHFYLSGCVNKQNFRILAEENPRDTVKKPMHPERVTAWCGLWVGGIIEPFFFENDSENLVTVNGERYRTMLTDCLWPKLNDMDVSDMWFQQVGATCHPTKATMALL